MDRKWLIAGAALASMGMPVRASEIFGGVFAHDVDTPFTASGEEDGIDLLIGWRGSRIQALRAIGAPSPHLYALVNAGGDTSFASAGISWKIGQKVYLRPGIGLAIHDGRDRHEWAPDRIYFGSRILFAPEIGVGLTLGPHAAIEASWIHFSHATLFSRHNPGSDNFGARVNYRF